MIDLNALKKSVEGKNVNEEVKKMSAPEGATRQRYLDFKFATPEERERIAKDNDTTVDIYEKNLNMLATMRGELKDSE
jgi:hypothetical protein